MCIDVHYFLWRLYYIHTNKQQHYIINNEKAEVPAMNIYIFLCMCITDNCVNELLTAGVMNYNYILRSIIVRRHTSGTIFMMVNAKGITLFFC